MMPTGRPLGWVNFANEKDRVVPPETGLLESHFEVACYDEGREGILQLNHDHPAEPNRTLRESYWLS